MFKKLANFFGGRHTLFIFAAFATGAILSWFHRLDGNLVTLLLGLGSLVFGHSLKEDYFAQKAAQTVNVGIGVPPGEQP